ncbi:MAG: hypothetical protein OSB41_03675 [Kiritimatiellae bacterium]|nr:hypothetical protein [Kiritimatiellia bacterium]
MAKTTLSDQILEIATDAIFLIERNGTIVRANRTAHRLRLAGQYTQLENVIERALILSDGTQGVAESARCRN